VGLKHGEQSYNDDSGRTYGVMIPDGDRDFDDRAGIRATGKTAHLYSIFLIFAMMTLYALCLHMQVGRHSGFFRYSYSAAKQDAGTDSQGSAPPLAFSIAVIILGWH
jgi:Ca2+:H+ antiporter